MDVERSFLSKFFYDIPIAFEVIRERGLIYLITYETTTEADTFLVKVNHLYSRLYARLLKKPLIHVIGNSHSMAFKRNRSFIVHNIGPATAYNLVNKNSSVRSNEKLFDIIEHIDVKRDIVIMVFGEIDCRVHFYNQYKKNGGKISMDQLMDGTIANYGEVLKQLKDLHVNFIVYGGLPATREIFRFPPYATKRIKEELFSDFQSRYPYLAPPEVRTTISREFNEKLRAYCEKQGYRYIDIYSVVADPDGFIKAEFVADEIHVNGKIMKYIKEFLETYQVHT